VNRFALLFFSLSSQIYSYYYLAMRHNESYKDFERGVI